MTPWLIIRTDFRKESYVAAQVRGLGFPAWAPCRMIASRPAIGRRVTAKAAVPPEAIPLLPCRLFAAVPSWAVSQTELDGIRHLKAIERTAEQLPVWIPSDQIDAFRAEIDRENTATLALARARDRKQKAKWRSLHDALLDMIEEAKAPANISP